MKASELISALQARIEIYGDWNVVIRIFGDDTDTNLMTCYGDDKTERIVVSDLPDIE